MTERRDRFYRRDMAKHFYLNHAANQATGPDDTHHST